MCASDIVMPTFMHKMQTKSACPRFDVNIPIAADVTCRGKLVRALSGEIRFSIYIKWSRNLPSDA